MTKPFPRTLARLAFLCAAFAAAFATEVSAAFARGDALPASPPKGFDPAAFHPTTFDATFEKARREGTFSGLAAFFDATGKAHLFAGGRVSGDDSSTPAANDAFAIASLTKVFVSLHARLLHDAGTYDLDASIAPALRTWGVSLDPRIEASPALTPRNLLRHGLGLHVEETGWPERFQWTPLTPDAVLRRVRISPTPSEKGTKEAPSRSAYCNACYDLVGKHLEDTQGKPLVDALHERFLGGEPGVCRDAASCAPGHRLLTPLVRAGGRLRAPLLPTSFSTERHTFRGAGHLVFTGHEMLRATQELARHLREHARSSAIASLVEDASTPGTSGSGLVMRSDATLGRLLWHSGSHGTGNASVLFLDSNGAWGAFAFSNLSEVRPVHTLAVALARAQGSTPEPSPSAEADTHAGSDGALTGLLSVHWIGVCVGGLALLFVNARQGWQGTHPWTRKEALGRAVIFPLLAGFAASEFVGWPSPTHYWTFAGVLLAGFLCVELGRFRGGRARGR